MSRAISFCAGGLVCAAVLATGLAGWTVGYDPLVARRALSLLWRGLAPSPAPLARAAFEDAVFMGRLEHPRLREASGLAASQRVSDRLWVLNDSDRVLLAVSPRGRHVGLVELPAELGGDWESLASFRLQGAPYLLIGDVGDNWAHKSTRRLIVLEEPDLETAPAQARVAWQLEFRFEDGPRDCEAVEVDASSQTVVLLSKRTSPPAIYALPLRPRPLDSSELQVARRVGEMHSLPVATEADRVDYGWRKLVWFGMPTGLSLSSDGRLVVVLTLQYAYAFERHPGDDWPDVFARAPARISIPPMIQSEALSFDREGVELYLTSEQRPAPLYRLRRLP